MPIDKTLLSSQLETPEVTPEKKLLIALLKRAIEDVVYPDRMVILKSQKAKINQIRVSAYNWLLNIENKKLGSIYWILENLTEDIESAHRKIMQLINSPETKDLLIAHCVTHRVYPMSRAKKKKQVISLHS